MNRGTPRLTARQVEKVLRRHGFEPVSQKGSHRKWRHPARRRIAIVPVHAGRVLPPGTMRSIMAGADLPPDAWESA